jgi:hypothetical protein
VHHSETAKPPSVKGGPGNLSSIGFADVSENKLGEHAPQEAITALRRDFTAEALRVVAIKAAHAADDVLLGDDHGAEREIRLAISHLREGSAAFRELQDSISARVSGEAER